MWSCWPSPTSSRWTFTVIVPGQADPGAPTAPVSDALAASAVRGGRMVSICMGAFALAAPGLLDGRRATTHWQYAATLAGQYPQVRVEPKVLYVDEGQVLTSAGVAAGLDLCLYLIRRDFGAHVANQRARLLVTAPPVPAATPSTSTCPYGPNVPPG